MDRARVGTIGEEVAAHFLARHGLSVVARNVELPGGEIDILALDGPVRVSVEVRTVTGSQDPLQAFGFEKASRVRSLANRIGAQRVDLVAIRLKPEAAEARWVKGAA